MTAVAHINAKSEYELRFETFLNQVMNISRLYPREQLLYPLMDTVAFKDMETAMLVYMMNYTAEVNDNS